MIFLPEIAYIICIVLLLSFCFLLTYKLYRFSMLILGVETAIEECLDLLNEKYGKMSSILQKPIFFDSIEIRQMVADLKDSHDAILTVADKLTLENKGFKSETKKEDGASKE